MTQRSSLPNWLAADFEALDREVIALMNSWQSYGALFRGRPLRLELLANVAYDFFNDVAGLLEREILLTICKLTENSTNRGKQSLSLLRIEYLVQTHDPHSGLGKSLKEWRKSFSRTAEQVTPLRNSRLAHLDRDVLTGARPTTGQVPTVGEMEGMVDDLSHFMNAVSRHYCHTETHYSLVLSNRDADSLIEYLKRGVRYDELEREGVIHWDDLRSSMFCDA